MSRAPTHPGAILREDVFPELGVTVSAAARELGVSRQTLHRILNEQTAVTPEMAARLGKYCGNGPGLWLRLQVAYDLWRAEEALKKELKTIPNRSHAESAG
jgi:antitoxin HigA-1